MPGYFLAGETGLGHLRRPRNFTRGNKLPKEGFLANCQWQFSPSTDSVGCIFEAYLGQNKTTRQAGRIILAGETGLEPATNGFGDRYSTD